MTNRYLGVLLPVTALPSQYGVGTLGKEAEKFIDFLECHEARTDQECEIYFKKGFRYAVRFILECFNEKF